MVAVVVVFFVVVAVVFARFVWPLLGICLLADGLVLIFLKNFRFKNTTAGRSMCLQCVKAL